MSDAMRQWRVALPWLARAAGATRGQPPLPSLDWLLARADRSPATHPWRQWLLEDAELGGDVLARFPAGPCVRAAWTGEPAVGRWACAGGVHLLTALDHLRLASPAPLPIEEDESSVLVAAINEGLAGSGFMLHSVPRRGWLCECPDDLDCDAPEPAAAIGGDLRNWLPEGRDAGRVRAWVNEAQMILHEHLLNAARAARGDPPVNSVWLWGIGSAGRPATRLEAALVTDDDWLKGLWQLHGGHAATVDAMHPGGALQGRSGITRIAIVGEHSTQGHGGWSARDRSLFESLRQGLERGVVGRVSIHAGSELLDLDGRARWRFWRRPRPLSEVPT